MIKQHTHTPLKITLCMPRLIKMNFDTFLNVKKCCKHFMFLHIYNKHVIKNVTSIFPNGINIANFKITEITAIYVES